MSSDHKLAFVSALKRVAEAAADNADGTGDTGRKVDVLNAFVELCQRSGDSIQTDCDIEALLQQFRVLLLDSHRAVRAATLRAIRYITVSSTVLPLFSKLRVYFFCIRSLDRDKKYATERMEALKLIRRVAELDCSALPRGVLACLISIAECTEDPFRPVCLETLCEITIRDARDVALCGGVRTIANAVLESRNEISDTLVMTLLYLLNDGSTRPFVRRHLDLEVVLSPMTDEYEPPDGQRDARRESCKQAVVTMLRSWAGILALASDSNGLKSIVDALLLPSEEIQDMALQTLFQVFGLALPSDDIATLVQEPVDSLSTDAPPDLPPRTKGRHDLHNNYKALLLTAFVHVGLMEALVQVGKDCPNPQISSLACVLLGELLRLSNFLPVDLCTRIHALPTLVNPAGVFNQPMNRSHAARVVSYLHLHARWHSQAHRIVDDIHLSLIVHGAQRWQRQKGVDRLRDRIDDLKRTIDWHMDDAQFSQLLKDSQIPSTKDYLKWNFDVIRELLEGPLRNPSRLVESFKPKFCKRLVSFLRPSKNQFCNLPIHPENTKYVRMACLLLEVLLSCKEGLEWLNNCGLLPQISKILAIELEKVPAAHTGRCFKPAAVRETLAREYFAMIGVLSSCPEGIDLLHRHNIIKNLYGVSLLPARDDLNRLMISSLDYNLSGHSQILLGKLITGGSKNIRQHGTRHLRTLLRAGVAGFEEWGIDMLVTQLQDQDQAVVEEALLILDEACQDIEHLEALIHKRPPLMSLGNMGRALMMRFLSHPAGFALLNEMSWILPQMQLWKDRENVEYVLAIEQALFDASNGTKLIPTTANPALLPLVARRAADPPSCVEMAPHFYGELVKTEEGCRLVEERGDFEVFHQNVISATNTNPNSQQAVEQRAALWAVGHIGASSLGYRFLQKHGLVNTIVTMAETHSCLSLRGTCFYVLGLLTRTEAGRQDLMKRGWDFPSDFGSTIALPSNPEIFFTVPDYHYEGSWPEQESVFPSPVDLNAPDSELRQSLVDALANLCNRIIVDTATRTLKVLRAKHPYLFTDQKLMFYSFALMGSYRYRLPVRRFIQDLFCAPRSANDTLSVLDSLDASYFV